MIAGSADVKVIKFCIHCNEVDTNTCDWLPIIYQAVEVGLCFFALDPERGDLSLLGNKRAEGERKEKNSRFFLRSASHAGSRVLVCVFWDRVQRKCRRGWVGCFRQWM